uniref:LPS export ABC transporter periplasmic protein LptC n=1 Tax=Chlorobium chlorochromatii (strain CaD3) TaxID=340177 RepID=Q3AQM0_CHLCH
MCINMWGCSNPETERRTSNSMLSGADHPSQEGWNIYMVLSESGREKAIIQAGHGAEFEEAQHLDNGVTLQLFDSNGSNRTTITANKAVIFNNQDIEAEGDVTIRSTSATGQTTRITTEYMKRTANDQMIRSDRLVTITRGEEVLRGNGFESDQYLKRFRIFRGSGEAVKQ